MFKKYFYILTATVGGALLGFLIHALLELWYIPKLVSSYDVFGFGLTWQTWFKIHELLVIIMTLGGAVGGLLKGKIWWQYIYVDKRWPGLISHIIKQL